MSTNFYAGKQFIGKRSAAGAYCWDCRQTLCAAGEARVHHSWNEDRSETRWHQSCPKCGKEQMKMTIAEGAGGRELGFNKGPFEEGKGVTSCSTFTWCMEPHKFDRNTEKIVDEYGREYTIHEFRDMLRECPIQFYAHINDEGWS